MAKHHDIAARSYSSARVRLGATGALLGLLCACVGGGGPLPDQGDGRGAQERSPTSGDGRSNDSTSDSVSNASSGSQDSGSRDDARPSICSPGSFVFCRCADRSDGTKQCSDDGTELGACVCDASDGG